MHSMKYWQVFDRTTGKEISSNFWTYEKEAGNVIVNNTIPFHRYTVSFLAFRIWEEISMYNHTTNNWDKEHLMQIDPIYPETREYLRKWMDDWCKEHHKPRYILDLLLSVINVSVQTVDIVKALPKLKFE